MIEVSVEMAEYIHRTGKPVYKLFPEEGTEALVEDIHDLRQHYSHEGIFGMEE